MEGGFLAAFLTSFTPQTVTSPQLWYTHQEILLSGMRCDCSLVKYQEGFQGMGEETVNKLSG